MAVLGGTTAGFADDGAIGGAVSSKPPEALATAAGAEGGASWLGGALIAKPWAPMESGAEGGACAACGVTSNPAAWAGLADGGAGSAAGPETTAGAAAAAGVSEVAAGLSSRFRADVSAESLAAVSGNISKPLRSGRPAVRLGRASEGTGSVVISKPEGVFTVRPSPAAGARGAEGLAPAD